MSTPKTVKVKNTEDLRNALAAGFEASNIEIDHSEALAAGTAGLHTADELAAAREQATKAERTRIASLQALAEPGFETQLAAAIETGATPEAFAMTLLREAKDRGITLGSIRKDAPPPAPHAKPSSDEPEPVGSLKTWSRHINRDNPAPKRM